MRNSSLEKTTIGPASHQDQSLFSLERTERLPPNEPALTVVFRSYIWQPPTPEMLAKNLPFWATFTKMGIKKVSHLAVHCVEIKHVETAVLRQTRGMSSKNCLVSGVKMGSLLLIATEEPFSALRKGQRER